MKNYKFIPNRLTNLAGVMPFLTIALSIPRDLRNIFIAMLPAKVTDNDFDFLVVAFKALPEGYTPFPMGVLLLPDHPLFPREAFGDLSRPTVWAGGARFSGYSIAFNFLELAQRAPTSQKKLRNLNNVACGIFEEYQTKGYYFYDTEFAGHKLLTWR